MNNEWFSRGKVLSKERAGFAAFLTEKGIFGTARRKEYCQFCKDTRVGNYLIKVSRRNKYNYCGERNLYIDYATVGDGWYSLSTRKNAQWFTAKEAYEFVNRNKGFTVVKR